MDHRISWTWPWVLLKTLSLPKRSDGGIGWYILVGPPEILGAMMITFTLSKSFLHCDEISRKQLWHRCDEAITLESWRFRSHWHRYHKKSMIRFGKIGDCFLSFFINLLERLWMRRRWMKKRMGLSSLSCYNRDNMQILHLAQGWYVYMQTHFGM